jgi:small subunit ribosomal protein S1
MAKEVLKPHQYARVYFLEPEALELTEEQQKELNSLYEETIAKLRPGQLVTGRVMSVDSNGVLVDIQYKSNGLIARYEFAEHELKALNPGSPIDVLIDELEGFDGNVLLSYEKAKELKAWDRITKLFEENKPVEGTVTHTVKGGLSVDIGVPAFLPGSQVDVQRVTDFDSFIGQTIHAEIIKINKKRGNVIISRRKFLSERRADARKKAMESLDKGQILQGVVKNITNYGAFIDIGGVDGLLHITDMTWGRISHPSEILKIGDTITVQLLSIDKDNNKISLGMKQLTDNPWKALPDSIQVGSKVKGKISSITDYGLFVEIQKGVEGLVHISEVSWVDRINDLSKHYKVGDEIEATVVSLDKENRRMSLSIKQLENNPWNAISEKFKPGQTVKGPITNITDFGIFIQLLPGVDGLAHVSDLSWTEHINHPADIYKKGQEVEAVVLSTDEVNKKVSLGVKQLTQDPWEKIEEEYPVGKTVEGEVSKITNFGAFIKLPTGIEGLVHISEAEQEGSKLEDLLKIGQKREFRIMNTNKNERKIGLSLNLDDSKKADQSSKAPKKQDASKSTKAKKERVDNNAAAKPKSVLQLELEKHAARKNSDE